MKVQNMQGKPGVEAVVAALTADESASKAQAAVEIMDRLYSRWESGKEWSGFAADAMREWEAASYGK